MRISFSSYCLLSFSFSYYSLNLSRLSCSNWLLYPFYKSSLFIGRKFVDKSASLLIVPSIVQQKLNVWEGSSEMDLRRYERPRRSPVRTREALLPLLCYCCFCWEYNWACWAAYYYSAPNDYLYMIVTFWKSILDETWKVFSFIYDFFLQ